jgi:membrane associated rhomboid family serine protease
MFQLTPAIRNILILNGVVFVLQILTENMFTGYFALSYEGLFGYGFIWTIVTYMFLHGGFGHIFFNMFGLWIFGTELEANYGSRRFYLLYFIGGIVGGIAQILVSGGSTIGASAGVLAVIVAFGFLFPERIIYINFLFPVKARWLAIFYVVMDVVGVFGGAQDGIARLAHLGGAFIGFLFSRDPAVFDRFGHIFSRLPKLIRVRSQRPQKQATMTFREGGSDSEKATFYQKKVDEILDKINEVGYLNLSDSEREMLDRGSRFLREYHRRRGN